MNTKEIKDILVLSETRKNLKNDLSVIDEKISKKFESIDSEYVEGNLVINSIKYDIEVAEKQKNEPIKWKNEFEKYVKLKKDNFVVVQKRITKKYVSWKKRNYSIIKLDATNKSCRHVLHSQSVVGEKIV